MEKNELLEALFEYVKDFPSFKDDGECNRKIEEWMKTCDEEKANQVLTCEHCGKKFKAKEFVYKVNIYTDSNHWHPLYGQEEFTHLQCHCPACRWTNEEKQLKYDFV